ncbi:MAG: BatA domain-containing protein [Bacteroidales bacterium]|jgi:hypothetical protein|nr:BatA domain-containing protein [Bacteroidales bacterium]
MKTIKLEKSFKSIDKMLADYSSQNSIKSIAYVDIDVTSKNENIWGWIIGIAIAIPLFLLQDFFEEEFGIDSDIQYILFLLILLPVIFGFNYFMKKRTKVIPFSDIIAICNDEILLFNGLLYNEKNNEIECEQVYSFKLDEIKRSFDFDNLDKWMPDMSSIGSAIGSTIGTALFKNRDKDFKIKLKVDGNKTLTLKEGALVDLKEIITKTEIHKKAIPLKYFAKQYLS